MYCLCLYFSFVFFFKQKTAYEMRISDWSSDVCSSDLPLSRRWRLPISPYQIFLCEWRHWMIVEGLSRRFKGAMRGARNFHILACRTWSNDLERPRRCSGESETNRCHDGIRSTLGERKQGIFGRWTPKNATPIWA